MTRHPDETTRRDEEPHPEDGPDAELLADRMRDRLILTLTSSYGISVLAHVLLLVLLASVVVFYRPDVEEVTLEPRLSPPETSVDEELPRDTERNFDVQETPDPTVRPVRELTPVPEPPEVPQGQPDAHANRRLEHDRARDAIGIGGGGATPYGRRDGNHRAAGRGVSEASEDAVLAALEWLARHQSPDGRWDADGFAESCSDGGCRGPAACSRQPGPGPGYAPFDAGVTGLALLAFLGHGETHQFGNPDFRPVVRKALAWLVGMPGVAPGIQADDGSIGIDDVDGAVGESIYNHAIATMAICEAYAMTRDPFLKPRAEEAVAFCLRARNPGYGWRYGVAPGDSDTSVTGWMVLALKAARVAELDVPDEAFDGAIAWLDRATVGMGERGLVDRDVPRAGRVGYRMAGDQGSFLPCQEDRYAVVPTRTAISVLCRLFVSSSRRRDDPVMVGIDILRGWKPTWSRTEDGRSNVNMYYWYYGAYAMFLQGDEGAWLAWNEAMQTALLPNQRDDGCEDGSWDPVGEWGPAGGRVYATAIGALTLEIYYRYRRSQESR